MGFTLHSENLHGSNPLTILRGTVSVPKRPVRPVGTARAAVPGVRLKL